MSKIINIKDLSLEGAAKWIHRFVMFITYPFRHFYAFLIMVVVAILICAAIPLLQGVSIRDIPVWYGQKLGVVKPLKKPYITAKPKRIKTVKFKKEIKLKHAIFEPKSKPIEVVNEPEIQEPEKYSSWNIKGKEISQEKEIQPETKVSVEVYEKPVVQIQELIEESEPLQTDAIKTQQPIIQEEIVSSEPPQKEALTELKYQKRDDLALTYYQTPRHVSGEAIIYGANELYVDDTYLYLYGIYTNPNIYDEVEARSYLRSLIANQNVDCYIVAETKDGIATAICFVAKKNINEYMVKAYLADNVAL